MNPRTEICMNSIVTFANEGNEIIPMFFTCSYGRATVSAAIRAALKNRLIEPAGKDGAGSPKYKAPTPINKNSPWFMES